MAYKKHEHVIGAVSIGDIKKAIQDKDDDDIVYLDGFSFSICELDSGNIEFTSTNCPKNSKELI